MAARMIVETVVRAESPPGKVVTQPMRTIKQSRRGNTVIAMILAMLISVTMLVWAQTPRAYAASEGPGEHFGILGFIGAYRLDNGSLAYCVEITVPHPFDPQQPTELVAVLPGFSGAVAPGADIGHDLTQVVSPPMRDAAKMRQINYVIDTWGETSSDAQATSVALAVFLIRGDSVGYTELIMDAVEERGGASHVARARSMVEEAKREAVPAMPGTTPGTPVIKVNETGVGTVSYSAGTTSLTLENAVFADTNSPVIEVASESAGVLQIKGVKPEGWDRDYDITVSANWRSGSEGWRAELYLHEPVVPTQQRVVTPTGKTTGAVSSGDLEAKVTVSHSWWPRVDTRVTNRIVAAGDTFTDTVIVEAHEESREWVTQSDGAPMPLTLTGTLYGPLEEDPTVSPQPIAPEDAPVFDRQTLNATGPGSYEIVSSREAQETGYYTWVWSIHWDDQPSVVTVPARTGTSSLDRSRFPIIDGYGLVSETHVVQQRVTMTTRLLEQEIGLGWSLIDDVAISPEQFGGWLKDDSGSNVPVNLRGTVYFTEELPVRAASVPEDASEIARTHLVVDDSSIATSDPIPLPFTGEGYVTVVWCVLDEDQDEAYRGLTREWCDDFGVPAETAQIISPRVTTLAQEQAQTGETIIDRADISGPVPNGAQVEFSAYLYPEVGDPVMNADWTELENEVWTEEMLAELTEEERCLAQPVAVTERVEVLQEGELYSPPVVAQSSGTVHWVERLFGTDPTSGEEHLVHEGECGLINETTLITDPIEEEPEEPVEAEPLAVTGNSTIQGTLALSALIPLVAGVALLTRRRNE